MVLGKLTGVTKLETCIISFSAAIQWEIILTQTAQPC